MAQNTQGGLALSDIEIRLEESESNRISYRGRELEDIGRARSACGSYQAL